MSRPEDLREDIQRVRGDLAETVDALVAKTEVKRRAEEKAHEVKDQAVHKAQELKERAAEKAHEVKEAATAKAHEVKERVETKARTAKAGADSSTDDRIDAWGGRVDGRVEAVKHRADSPSGSHPLGQATGLLHRKSVQAGALGLFIGALIALITRNRGR